MRLIDGLTRKEMENSGHQEYNFPLLVPEDLLEKENHLVSRLKAARELGVDPSELRIDEEDSGFKKEVYWVTKGGENELDIPMFLRPTSETPMYTMFSLWVRSHADLPLKTFQIVNTFRYETKQTRSFIRVREIHFFEAHTVHKDEEGATKQIEQDAEIVQRLMKSLCMSVLVSKRPVWDTFPGAWYTTAVDAIMPNGRTLQIATYHHYRDQWAQAFDLNYEDSEGNIQNCHQTTFGMSERLLGAVVGMHGDDSGLILPPSVSPYQIILMPVAAHVNEKVIPRVNDLAKELSSSGFRVYVDDRDIRPGSKHYDWEIKGAPIRLELGPRDLEGNKCVISLRTGGKTEVSLDNLPQTIQSILDDISQTLLNRSSANMSELVKKFSGLTLSESGWQLNSPIEDGIIYELAFDGNDADAEVLEKATGLVLLGDCVEPYSTPIPCAITGKLTTRKQHLARMY
jgi:prolyl-tRNA synthetase